MPFAENGSVKLYYEVHGDGEPLLLLMGLGGTTQAWGLQVPELSKHYRVVIMDNRGAGRSDMPTDDYSMALFADDAAAVLDAAGIDQAHVLGISMGGLIAQEFYHRHAERVASLILAASSVGGGDPAVVFPTPEVMAVLHLDREQVGLNELAEKQVAIYYHPNYRGQAPMLVEQYKKLLERSEQPAHAYQGQWRAIREAEPLSPRLENIDTPTLVLHGDGDEVCPLENGRILASGIAGARFQVLPGAGHMLMVEKARAFNRAVLDFLATVPLASDHAIEAQS